MLPVVSLGIRAHFSNFSTDNQVTIDGGSFAYTYSRTIQDYDYGLTAVGGVSLGLVKPYIGVGLGSNNIQVQREDIPESSPIAREDSDSKIFWNALLGAEVSAILLLHPFVEYRYTDVGESFFRNIEEQGVPQPSSSNSRVIFGVLLRF